MSEDRPTDPLYTPPKRRMLPSVSDVVRELSKVSPAEPSILFKVAREVCAEELNRVKQGKESEPLEVLVRRARVRLDPSLAAPPPPPAAMAEPFEETTGALDLKWDRESREPLAEMMPGPEPASPAPVPAGHGLSILPADDAGGPGDDTLTGLAREADNIDLKNVRPEEFVHSGPAAAEATERMEASVPEGPRAPSTPRHDAPARESAPETAWDDVEAATHGKPAPKNRRGLLLTLLALLAALGGFAAYTFLAKPAADFSAVRVRSGPPLARRRPTPAAVPDATPAPAPTPTAALPKATAAAPRPRSPAAAPLAPAPPTPPAAKPVPAPTAARTSPVSPAQSGVLRQTRAALLLSRDWAGKEALFVLHFSSYKDRPSAEKDAAAIAKRIGKTARAVEVDLGDKGTWYRVVLGEFATAEDAFAFRSDLEAKGTPGMGFVYRLQPEIRRASP